MNLISLVLLTLYKLINSFYFTHAEHHAQHQGVRRLLCQDGPLHRHRALPHQEDLHRQPRDQLLHGQPRLYDGGPQVRGEGLGLEVTGLVLGTVTCASVRRTSVTGQRAGAGSVRDQYCSHCSCTTSCSDDATPPSPDNQHFIIKLSFINCCDITFISSILLYIRY